MIVEVIYFAEFRKNNFKDWKWRIPGLYDDLDDFDNKIFQQLLKDILKKGNPKINSEFASCFGEFVQLENRVKIKELTSIGHNVTIGEDTMIEKSVLWDEIKIGSGCIITESIICNNCEIGDNVVLVKAIIAPNCKVSSNSQIRDRTLELGQEI